MIIERLDLHTTSGPVRVSVLLYPDQESAARAFCRPTEFRESPTVARKAISREYFEKQYVPKRGPTYYLDRRGSCMKRDNILEWLAALRTADLEIDAAEDEMLQAIPVLADLAIVTYASHPDLASVLWHEVAHAAWASEIAYREQAELWIDRAVHGEVLEKAGYARWDILDEIQAYYVGPSSTFPTIVNPEAQQTLRRVLKHRNKVGDQIERIARYGSP